MGYKDMDRENIPFKFESGGEGGYNTVKCSMYLRVAQRYHVNARQVSGCTGSNGNFRLNYIFLGLQINLLPLLSVYNAIAAGQRHRETNCLTSINLTWPGTLEESLEPSV